MANGKSLPNRIQQIRKAKGLTLAQLSEILPDSPSDVTINRWEHGARQISAKRLGQVAAALGVTVSELLAETADVRRAIPVLGVVQAGHWREAIEDAQGEMSIGAAQPGDFALRVMGDSMDRLAPEGSLVVIDASDRDLHDKRVYVVANSDGETTFKRYMSSPARLEPVSTNPDHQPIRIGHDAFRVIGRVTQVEFTL